MIYFEQIKGLRRILMFFSGRYYWGEYNPVSIWTHWDVGSHLSIPPRYMTFVQKTLRHLPEVSSLSDPDGNGFGIDARLKIVIPPEPLIESIQEPTVVFSVSAAFKARLPLSSSFLDSSLTPGPPPLLHSKRSSLDRLSTVFPTQESG